MTMHRKTIPPDILADLMSASPGGQNAVVEIPLSLIDDNPYQERQDYGDLTDLANDIREHGILQPPLARLVDGRYQLALGHRRKRACELANLHTMPLIVRALTDEAMATVAFSENEHRQDVSILDKARAIHVMQTTFGWTQQQIADKLSISRPAVANMLRLLRLPENLQARLASGEISARQAEALLAVHELPQEVKARAEQARWNETTQPSAIVRDALAGASSDSIRERMRKLLEAHAYRVDDQPWYRQEFSHPDVEAQRCDACPHAIRRDVGVYCPFYSCWRHKDEVATRGRLEPAARVAGVPVADNMRLNSCHHEDFRFEGRHVEEILSQEPRCKNLRVVEIRQEDAGKDFPGAVPGYPGVAVVCQKAGNHQCACIQRRQRAENKTSAAKTPGAAARAIAEDAARVVVDALRASAVDPDLLRLVTHYIVLVRDYGFDAYRAERRGPREGDEFLREVGLKAFVTHVHEWQSVADNKRQIAGLLALAGLPSPWPEEATT